ncbi:hypothetical protein [Collimonas humicola]|uniref:hypothetical protein n=1 Tax=Collimonas humicola TaxID=2825886 RepID=UPI001B8B3FE7|nr:hypothetical protein [Collimonas humicola]
MRIGIIDPAIQIDGKSLPGRCAQAAGGRLFGLAEPRAGQQWINEHIHVNY